MVEKEKRMNQIFNRRKDNYKFSLMTGKNGLQHKKVANASLFGGKKGENE